MVSIYLDTLVVVAAATLIISFVLEDMQEINSRVVVGYSQPVVQRKEDSIIHLNKNTNESEAQFFLTLFERFHRNSFKRFDKENHIFFILTTEHTLNQPAKLIKIAQALFPVREFVTLVLVKTYSLKNGIQHLASLDGLLKRFGISYVILSNRQFYKCVGQVSGIPDSSSIDFKTRHLVGRVVGLLWVIQNAQLGVILMANESYTYYHRIFNEIRYTKRVSTWPIALSKTGQIGFSTPIVHNQSVAGYFDDHFASFGNVRFQVGGFAININYLKQKATSMNFLVNLAADSYTNENFGIPIEDIAVLGDFGNQINVWRTVFTPYPWPKRIGLKPQYEGTNMPSLMKNFFGETMYYEYYGEFKRTLDNKNSYFEYNND